MKKSTRLLTRFAIAIVTLISSFGYASAQTPTKQVSPPKTVVAERQVVETAKSDPTGEVDSLINRVRLPTPSTENDPTLTHEIFEDFVNGSNHTPLEKINQLAASGGGTGQGWFPGQVYEDAWGVIEANHGTGSFSRLDLVGKSPNMYRTALGIGTAYEYQVRFNIANLSNPTNRYITTDGFFDSDTVDPEFNRGLLFRYSDDINGGRFQVVVRSTANVETLIDTGVTVATDNWYRLKICVNAAGTEAQFYIDGTLVAVATENIAIGPNNRYTAESNTDRLTGNSNFVSRRFDYVRYRVTSGRGSRL
jgi:hypothetical protein